MKRGFTDIHHHILNGLDDGAQNYEEMRSMLHNAHEQGIARIVATPHVTPGVERFEWERYEHALREARACCAEEHLPIQIYGGAEILYTPQTCRFLEDGRVPTMAHTDYVLVEFSPDVRYEKLRAALEALRHSDYLPIVAHAERYLCLVRHPSRPEELRRELDVCFQINCGTIIRQRDFHTRRFLRRMIDQDMIDAIGTDAHRASIARVANMREAWHALRSAYGSAYANQLTDGHLLFEDGSGERDGDFED